MVVFGTQGACGHSLPRAAMVQFARQVSAANYHIVSCGAHLALSSRSPLIDVPAAAQLRGAVNFEVRMRLRITFAPGAEGKSTRKSTQVKQTGVREYVQVRA